MGYCLPFFNYSTMSLNIYVHNTNKLKRLRKELVQLNQDSFTNSSLYLIFRIFMMKIKIKRVANKLKNIDKQIGVMQSNKPYGLDGLNATINNL